MTFHLTQGPIWPPRAAYSSRRPFIPSSHHLIAPHSWYSRLYLFRQGLSGILVPQTGIEPVPLQWKHRVRTTGLPGKSHWCSQLYFPEGRPQLSQPCFSMPDHIIDHGHLWIIYPWMRWPPFILSAKRGMGGLSPFDKH